MRRDVCLRTKCECAKRTLSSWALSAGILVSLSKQQFADCDTTDVGCNEGFMDYTSVFAEKIASTSRYTGYKPNNASSGLKHWRIHEHASRPLVDWTTKSGCASEASGTVWLALDIFNNNVFGRLLLEICWP